MNAEYQQYLSAIFVEEVEGEAFFSGLSERAADAEHQHKWQVLAQLETQTKEHIRAGLRELGIEVAEQRHNIERGEQLAERFSKLPWLEFLTVFQPSLQKFVAQYSAGEQLIPDEGRERPLLRYITRHEQALLAFVICELQGRGAESLDAVLALLGKPLHQTAAPSRSHNSEVLQ
ncbi:hypothetical protein NVV93_09640 [Pseudomonas sp. LS44]|uniref:hypothetical protein n=1 Tax=Pseudomonas sp. LS44 TaxID=1357074 RepID=UPI00215AF163|nr:hypothetical protein [Pseudomonas sp. LS44]UVE19606.1 hypothetical protein NVV93_09640 [Pseudomonas sp. LS44]